MRLQRHDLLSERGARPAPATATSTDRLSLPPERSAPTSTPVGRDSAYLRPPQRQTRDCIPQPRGRQESSIARCACQGLRGTKKGRILPSSRPVSLAPILFRRQRASAEPYRQLNVFGERNGQITRRGRAHTLRRGAESRYRTMCRTQRWFAHGSADNVCGRGIHTRAA